MCLCTNFNILHTFYIISPENFLNQTSLWILSWHWTLLIRWEFLSQDFNSPTEHLEILDQLRKCLHPKRASWNESVKSMLIPKSLGNYREWISKVKNYKFELSSQWGHCCWTLLPIPRDFGNKTQGSIYTYKDEHS